MSGTTLQYSKSKSEDVITLAQGRILSNQGVDLNVEQRTPCFINDTGTGTKKCSLKLGMVVAGVSGTTCPLRAHAIMDVAAIMAWREACGKVCYMVALHYLVASLLPR